MTRRDPLTITGTPRYEFKPPCVCSMVEDLHIPREKGGRGACGGTVRGPSGAVVRCPCLAYHAQRLSTPGAPARSCNSCGRLIGDVTTAEIRADQLGELAPDATGDCPTCWAAQHLPHAQRLTQPVGETTRPARTQARVRGVRRG